jgi:hypothetical protein
MNLTMMNNVVIEDKKGLFEDKKAWLGVGVLVGLILN